MPRATFESQEEEKKAIELPLDCGADDNDTTCVCVLRSSLHTSSSRNSLRGVVDGEVWMP